MKFSATGSNLEFDRDNTPSDRLRAVETMNGVRLDDWHFKLAEQIEPVQVNAWFGKAKYINGTIYFDGKSKIGKLSYAWAQDRFKAEIYNALGDTTIAMASDGEIVKEFQTGRDKHGKAVGSIGNKITQSIEAAKGVMSGIGQSA
jgi:hypothetical protein